MSTQRLKLPYAVSNFEALHEEGYFFVDKTAYIRELENFKVPVFLRPRRFGKTLWCSTLECYYDILRKDRFQELFGHLQIGQNPTGNQNRFMVMRLNFSLVQVSEAMTELERNFRDICHTAMSAFLKRYGQWFQGRLTLEPTDPVSKWLDLILTMVKEEGLPPVYLIIDEYDNFSNQYITSGRNDLYENLTTGDSFFRTFFKAVKAGCESRAIGKVFITGVLPVTMDDLTSGFNIAEIVTLDPSLHGMLGFTQAEVDDYLEKVVVTYDLPREDMPSARQTMRNWYNGYRFLPQGKESLYNATILTYFLKYLALHGGEFPQDMIDPNVKTDVSWIKRLGFGGGTPEELVTTLLQGHGLPFDARNLRDKFNMERFFQEDHYATSLFFLGMLTVKDRETLAFPNQTLASIFADYYNTLMRMEVSKSYVPWFRAFRQDRNLGDLFGGYWKAYIGQIPAQAFDKVNENFIRTTFFELCTRHLVDDFTFGIEVNYPSGRCDWEMTGRSESVYRHQKWMVEFKYHPASSGISLESLTEPPTQAVAQIKTYAAESQAQFPQDTIRTAVCVIVGNTGYRWFVVDA
jgi:hypothetical protein